MWPFRKRASWRRALAAGWTKDLARQFTPPPGTEEWGYWFEIFGMAKGSYYDLVREMGEKHQPSSVLYGWSLGKFSREKSVLPVRFALTEEPLYPARNPSGVHSYVTFTSDHWDGVDGRLPLARVGLELPPERVRAFQAILDFCLGPFPQRGRWEPRRTWGHPFLWVAAKDDRADEEPIRSRLVRDGHGSLAVLRTRISAAMPYDSGLREHPLYLEDLSNGDLGGG